MDREPSVNGRISTTFAAVFYGLAVLAAWFFGSFLAELDLLEWHNRHETGVQFDALIGVGCGLLVVVVSALLERVAEWARRLSQAFADILGPLTTGQVFVLALTSSIGEELFFRGFLQQWLSVSVFDGAYGEWIGLTVASIIFGAVHIGPEPRTFWPWTAMAVVMGFALGGMYMYTGNVLAPILAHFTINFLNLSLIAQQARREE